MSKIRGIIFPLFGGLLCGNLFQDVLNSEDENEIDVSKNVQAILKEQIWRLEDEIYFLTQPGVMNLTYPCMTTLGGVTPGRPCVFPVTWTWW